MIFPDFERLAQRFEYAALELRQLVEEQHAVVGERDLARHGRRAAAAQRHRAGGVMRRAEDARGPALRCKLPDQTQHRGRLERFVRSHRRQDPGEALCQHGLAGARRPDQQYAVSAGGRNLDRTTRDELALDVEEIRVNWRRQPDHGVMFGDCPRRTVTGLGAQMLDDLQQRARGKDGNATDQCRLIGALVRHHEAAARTDRVF